MSSPRASRKICNTACCIQSSRVAWPASRDSQSFLASGQSGMTSRDARGVYYLVSDVLDSESAETIKLMLEAVVVEAESSDDKSESLE